MKASVLKMISGTDLTNLPLNRIQEVLIFPLL